MSVEKDVRNFLNGISENSKIYFDCETDKNPISYKAGEEMIFRLCVKTCCNTDGFVRVIAKALYGVRSKQCTVYIEAGLGDYVCPPSGQMAMYNAIKAPKLLRFVQNQTHPYRPVIKRYFSLCDCHPNPDFKF